MKIYTEGREYIYELRSVVKLPNTGKITWVWSPAEFYPRVHCVPEIATVNKGVIDFNGHQLSALKHGLFGNCTGLIVTKEGKTKITKIKLVKMDEINFSQWTKDSDWNFSP
jgi:hypothetical protein